VDLGLDPHDALLGRQQTRKVSEPLIINVDSKDGPRRTLDWIFAEKTRRFSHTSCGAKALGKKKDFCWRICLDALQNRRLFMSELWVANNRFAVAEILREIFAAYVKGRTPRDIAHDLNKRGIRPPRGTHWNASTINGHATRGAGILINQIYIGEIVWNKTRFVKDPTTGKRISRVNPPEQHRRARVPHLRIIDGETWSKAQASKIERVWNGGMHDPHGA
jgi:hypothetical protein